jgi:protein-L-isoaspartate(D-aspartate) O-methyltransferase
MNFAQARLNMTQSQVRPNRVTNAALLQALGEVEREIFVPQALQNVAYCDQTLLLPPHGFLLAPLTLARLIDALNLKAGDKVLNITRDTGYTAALLARMEMSVFALVQSEEAARWAQETLATQKVFGQVHHGALTAGLPADAPFDGILIDGTIDQLPQTLIDQLAEGGRAVAITYSSQRISNITIWQKTGNQVSMTLLSEASAPRLEDFATKKNFVF